MIWLFLSIFGVGAVAQGMISAKESKTSEPTQIAPANSQDVENDMIEEDDTHSEASMITMSEDDEEMNYQSGTDDGKEQDDAEAHDADQHETDQEVSDDMTASDGAMDHADQSAEDDAAQMGMDHIETDHSDMDQEMDQAEDGEHSDHDHEHVDLNLPQTAEEIAAFVESVVNFAEVHVHDDSSTLMAEHMAALDLVDRAEATHIAIGNGSWFDPNNWHNGEVPGDDAKVLVSEGITMEYDAQSTARLFTVRVDGELNFATDQDSTMVVDTFVVAPSGTLTIGTEEDPVQDDVTAEIVIANNGPIDVDWDPSLLSRGLISHGETTIHGQIKDSHDKVIDDPMAGDTSVTFEDLPVGWEVGDKIVIAGTDHKGHYLNKELGEMTFHESEDEIRIITDIQDNIVFFDTALEYDHGSPRDDLFTSVANYSRNVKIGTENPETAEVYERGHVMFMHSDNVDVRYAEFDELGRTDKSEDAVDADEVETIAFDTNVKGRYSMHLHRTGTEDQDDPAIAVGNSVFGSPGWGFVHHDSNAILDNNASFNTFGAGFVAESGNETGVWSDNIAILAEGNTGGDPKLQSDSNAFDTARSGDGFWLQSRLIEVADNVAASVNHGFVYYQRGQFADDAQLLFDSDTFAFPEAFFYDDTLLPTHAPILTFQDNETFASKEGLHIVKSNPDQGHDIHSELDGFTAWNVVSGAQLEYTSHYTLSNFDLIASEPDPDEVRHLTSYGIELHKNVSDVAIVDAEISGFDTGIDLFKFFVSSEPTEDQHQYHVIDVNITDSENNFENYDPTLDTVASSSTIPGGTPALTLDGPLVYSNEKASLLITGTKTDSLGDIDFPSGTDEIKITFQDMAALLKEKGYYSTDTGEKAVVLDIYFSDRLTGEFYKQPTLVHLDEDVNVVPNGGRYQGAVHNGEVTTEDLEAKVSGGASKVEYVSRYEIIQTEDLYNLTVHDNWEAYDALTLKSDAGPLITLGIWDATNDVFLRMLNDGDVIGLSELGDTALTILATPQSNNPQAGDVESVQFDLNSGAQQKLENLVPYALFGDGGVSNVFGQDDLFELGLNTLSVDAFSGDLATGTQLADLDLDFTIVDDREVKANDDPANVGEDGTVTIDVTTNDQGRDLSVISFDASGTLDQVTDLGNGQFSYDPAGAFDTLETGEVGIDSFTYTVEDATGETSTANMNITVDGQSDAGPLITLSIWDATNDVFLRTLEDGDVIGLSELGDTALTILATPQSNNPQAGDVESVQFDLNSGAQQKLENLVPYALFGDGGVSNVFGQDDLFDLGLNTLSIDAFSGDLASGSQLANFDLNFTIVHDLIC